MCIIRCWLRHDRMIYGALVPAGAVLGPRPERIAGWLQISRPIPPTGSLRIGYPFFEEGRGYSVLATYGPETLE